MAPKESKAHRVRKVFRAYRDFRELEATPVLKDQLETLDPEA
jgi:hypothetical protein